MRVCAHAGCGGIPWLLDTGVDGRECVADFLTKRRDDGDANSRDERNHDAVFDHRCAFVVAPGGGYTRITRAASKYVLLRLALQRLSNDHAKKY
jgi:hypothetical protein